MEANPKCPGTQSSRLVWEYTSRAAAIAALLSAATAPARVSPPPGRKHSVLVPSAAPQRMPMAGVRLALPGRRKAPLQPLAVYMVVALTKPKDAPLTHLAPFFEVSLNTIGKPGSMWTSLTEVRETVAPSSVRALRA